ncbi:unnamed protein product [Symbiodinium sp. CCMP2592]|nr:unnamed protein product [Symbiodinium sp. CCMP2592]
MQFVEAHKVPVGLVAILVMTCVSPPSSLAARTWIGGFLKGKWKPRSCNSDSWDAPKDECNSVDGGALHVRGLGIPRHSQPEEAPFPNLTRLALDWTRQALTKFVLTSFPNIGLPLNSDRNALTSWLSRSTRRHKVLFAIPGKSEEES